MIDSPASIPQLKAAVARLGQPARAPALFALGEADTDARLGGGLAVAGLHEAVCAATGDATAALGFALMLTMRASAAGRILFVSTDRQTGSEGQLYNPGLVELGMDPARLLIVHAADELAALRAASDGLATAGLGAVVIDTGEAKKLDLTASRRLLLAAERSGTTGIVLRGSDTRFASAASTRWQVAAAPSQPLPGPAPGHVRLRVALLRHRGGVPPFETLLEWDRDRHVFRAASLLRDLPAAAERGQMAA